MYMGDRFGLFELLIAGLCANLFSLSFCDKKGEKVLVSFLVIDIFDKGSSISFCLLTY
jgi:hypothetical protein